MGQLFPKPHVLQLKGNPPSVKFQIESLQVEENFREALENRTAMMI